MPTAETTRNRLESTDAGIALADRPGTLDAWFVVALRLVMGGAFLGAGLGKFAVFADEPFDGAGYLIGSEGPVAGLYAAMAVNASSWRSPT
jgi:thiosulfate dehydrogenase (quinone) large subunit